MKYGLNRINIILFTQQVRWLDGKGVEFHYWVQGLNFTNDNHCGQQWNINWIFYLPRLLRLVKLCDLLDHLN
jgi:hypothetical protein